MHGCDFGEREVALLSQLLRRAGTHIDHILEENEADSQRQAEQQPERHVPVHVRGDRDIRNDGFVDDVDVSELGLLLDGRLVVALLDETVEPLRADALTLEAGELDALTGDLPEPLLVFPDRALQGILPGPQCLELELGLEHLLLQRSEIAERIATSLPRPTSTAFAREERLNEGARALLKTLAEILDLIVDVLQPLLVHRLAEDIRIALGNDNVALHLKPSELVLELADVRVVRLADRCRRLRLLLWELLLHRGKPL